MRVYANTTRRLNAVAVMTPRQCASASRSVALSVAMGLALILLSGCQSGVRRDLSNQTIGDLIDNNGLRPEQMGISVQRSATASVSVPEDRAQIEAQQSTRRAIGHYDHVVNGTAKASVRAESLRRAADLRVEAVEQRQIDGQLGYADDLHAAIAGYQTLLQDYRDYSNLAQVYYQLARAHELAGELDQTIQYLLASAAAPHSGQLAAEARFRAAELLAQRNDYQRAATLYGAVMDGESNDYTTFARYKRGWSYYQLGEYRKALADMAILLDAMVAGSGAGPFLPTLDTGDLLIESVAGEQREMTRDALRLTVLSLAADTAIDIDQTFSSPLAVQYRDSLYRQLGLHLLEKERYTDASAVYRQLVSSRGQGPDTANAMVKAVEALQAGGFARLAIAAREEYVDLYQGYLSEQDTAEDELSLTWIKYCQDVAAWHHKAAMESQREGVSQQELEQGFMLAASWHQRLLTRFPRHRDAAKTTVYYADALFNAGELQRAAEAYSRAGYDFTPFEGAPDAALAAVKSYRSLLGDELGDVVAGDQRPRLIDQFVQASDRFVATFSDHRHVLDVEMDSLHVLFAAELHPRLITAANRMLAKPAVKAKLRAEVLAMLGESTVSVRRYADAEDAFSRLLAQPELATPRREQVRERLAYATYRHAEELRDSGLAEQRQRAAEKLMDVVSLSSDAAVKASAHYDAALLRYELSQWQASAALFNQFMARYPDSELITDAQSLVASAYEESEDFTRAAEAYRRIALHSKTALSVRYQASLKAAELYRRVGDMPSVAHVYEDHLRHFPEPVAEAQRIRWQLAALVADQDGSRQSYEQRLLEIVDIDRQHPDLPDELHLIAAKSSLALAEGAIDRAREIRLSQPLQESLARRRQAMDDAVAALDRAMTYQFASVTTAASHKLGILYLDFAKALLNSDRPDGLSDDVLAEYRLLLEEQAFPFEEKAIAVLEGNLTRLHSGVWNPELRKSLMVLTQLEPARYQKRPKLEGVYHALR